MRYLWGIGLAFTALVACGSAVAPTSSPIPREMPSQTPTEALPVTTPAPTPAEPTPAPTPTLEREAPATSPAKETTVNLNAVPAADLSKHSVPLEAVIFDTFDGFSVRLPRASQERIESLRDAIKPIYNPGYGDAGGLPWLKDRDSVIGYESNGNAYAYPVKILNFRELVNDVIDGVPVLVSYCPLCASGVVYSRELEGETLLFGNTSALYESDLVMFDHQTGSYWFQVLGEAIVGKMTAKRLTPLPAVTTTWGEWKRLHPDTRLLVSDEGVTFDSRYATNAFGFYGVRVDNGEFSFPVSDEKLDDRLRNSAVVITAEVNSAIKAYPLFSIGEAAVNDEVGDQHVVVFSRRFTGSAFLAKVSGMQLTFQLEDDVFVDQETGSTWNEAGRAVAGPLEGSRLEPLPSRRGYWFSIAGAFPGLELYQP